MVYPMGESKDGVLRLDFDRRLKLEFHGSKVTTDAGLLAYRELDDALGLTLMVGDELVDPRTGKNGQRAMKGLFRQSVFVRLGGYEDVNDADCLGRDPAMRWIVGRFPRRARRGGSDDLARREMLARRFVGDFRKPPDQILEQVTHLDVADAFGV